jgi:hypothetical protein
MTKRRRKEGQVRVRVPGSRLWNDRKADPRSGVLGCEMAPRLYKKSCEVDLPCVGRTIHALEDIGFGGF